MNIEKYIDRSENIILLSRSEEVKAVDILLSAIGKRREELRKIVEEHPKHCPENLEDDADFILGTIKGLNWVLELPQRSRDFINKIK